MASSAISKLTATEQAQFFYVTYYGRPADPAGLKYWADVISKNGLDSVAKDFSNSAEAKVKYPSLGTTSNLTQLKTDIQTLYKTVFGRDPLATDPATGKPYDAAGLDYWYNGVAKGNFSFGQLSIILYNAAAENPITQQDVVAIGNRSTAAQSFTDSLKTPAQIAAYSGQTAVTSSATWLATVDYRAETVTNAVASKSDLIFNLVINPEKPNTANPVIAATSVSVNEDAVASGKVSATDADNTTLTYAADASSAQGGTVAINSSTGAFTYTPKANFAGSDSFKVTVSDGQGGVTSSTVNVTVKEVNEVVAKVSLAATEDSAKSTAISFTNPGSETLAVAVKTQPTNGAVSSFAADGSYTYTPKANYNGTDTFVIQVTDGTKISTQEVTVTVASVNDLPTFAKAADTIAVTEDVAFKGTVSAVDVDTADTSPDAITYTASTATKGVVAIDGKTGAYTYTPNANANGSDAFVLTATDKAGEKSTQSITVNIAATNDAPTADSVSSKTTLEDSVLSGTMGAKDVDQGAVLSYAVKTQGAKGTVAVATDGSYVYTPNANANGSDSFVITASDGSETVSQTVNVTITPVNDSPSVTASVSVSVNEDQSFTRAVGATDPDTGDVLTYAIKTAPSRGVASVNSAGTVSYSPELNYAGADSIVIEVTDAAGAITTQTLAITVTGVNDAPVAVADTASVVGGGAVNANVLTNDSDVDGDALTVTSANAGRGNVSIGANGVLSYQSMTGDGSPTGVVDVVSYTVSDGKGGTATSTLTVTVFTRTGGSSGNDTLGGSTSAEIINGLAGDDEINGGGGYDQITAGAGNDVVAFSEDAKFIRGGPDTDTLKLSYAGDFRFDLTAANQYIGSTKNAASFAETVTVTDFENIDGTVAQVQVFATGVAAGSYLIGGDLNDSLTGGVGSDTLVGGLDNDTLIGGTSGSGIDSILGGSGSDTIFSASSVSGAQLVGDAGNDSITFNNLSSSSAVAAATIDGGTGNDSITIGASGSVIGGEGNDTIVIGAGSYSLTVSGGAGNETIVSSGTGDSLQIDAGAGNDTIRVDGKNDSIVAGSGNDRITLTTTGADSTITISGGQGTDTLIFGLDTSSPGDSIISSADLAFVSGVEFITFGGTGAETVNGSLTISGSSIAGGSDLLGITLTGGDTLTLTNFAQTLTINLSGIDQGPVSVSANTTTGAIVVVADSLQSNDTLNLSGADDTFTDTIAAGVTYDFTNAGSLDFISLTGAATVAGTATVNLVTGQSLTLTSNSNGDSLALSVNIVNGAAGSDTVTIQGGSWHDTINLTNAEKATVYGGDGADSVLISGAASDSLYVEGQGGADTLHAGKNDTVYGGSGNDVIVLLAGSQGADSTTIIDGGDGTDTARLSAGVTSSALNNLTSIEAVDLTASGVSSALTLTGGTSSTFGTILIDGDSLTFTTDFGGTGTTSISLSAGTSSSDSIARVTADSLSDLVISANEGIGSEDVLNAGSETSPTQTTDVITASISSSTTFNLTNVDNFDSLTIARATTPSGAAVATVTEADSISIIVSAASADSLSLSLTAATAGFVTVTSGAGNDYLVLSSARFGNRYTDSGTSSADSVLADQDGDSVNDWLSVGGGADSILVDARDSVYAGAGNDTILSSSTADSLNALYIDADTGSDLISVNGSYDWISAGGDNDLIVLTGSTNLATATVDGGSGVDTVRFTAAVSLADSVFANFSNVEVIDLATNAADVVTLGSFADIAGFTTVLLGEADTISMVGMGTTLINLGSSASGAFRITSDSLTTLTLFADTGSAIESGDVIQLSTVTGGSDQISIRGSGDSTYAFDSSDRGVDSIVVNSATARVVSLTGLGSDALGGLTVSVASGDTVSTIYASVSGADSLTYVFSLGAGSDSIVATTGKISVVGGNGAESITSGSAADYIDVSGSGAADSDFVNAGSGNDTVIAGSGNDTINVSVGVDSVDAGLGDDVIFITGLAADSLGADIVLLGAGADSLLVSGTAGSAVNVDLGTGSDSVTLSSKNDTVTHSASDSSFDVIVAGSGSDYIDLSAASVSGTNIVDLGADSDQFIGGLSGDSVNGDAGNDTIITGGGVDIVYGGAGNDSINVAGTNAADSNTAFGEDGNDTIIGGSLNDTLDGGSGNDSIEAGSGADSVNVGLGAAADYVDLGAGNDIVVLGSGAIDATTSTAGFTIYDTLKGSDGTDTLSVQSPSAALSAFNNLSGVSGFEVIAVSGTSGTNEITLNDVAFDSAISLSFTGAASVSVNNSFITETGTVTVSADTAVAALTITAKAGLTEIASVFASDSLNGDLHFQGDSSDKVVLLGMTATSQFVMNDVKVGTIELSADSTPPLYDLSFVSTATSGSMTVSIAGSTAEADSTQIYWNNSADTIAIAIYSRNADDVIRTGFGADYISTGSGADSVIAGSGADTIDVGSGANTVRGEAGNDLIFAYVGADSIDAGAGNDTIQLSGSLVAEVADSANVVNVGTGIDWVYGGGGADSVGADEDSLGDWFKLYSGSDTVYAGAGIDTIDVSGTGSGDSDYVSSGDGNDSVVTGDGNDSVVDGHGFDTIFTGSGNDIVTLNADSAGVDYIYLGVGLDSLYATADSGGVYVSITGGDTGADIIMTGNGNDSIYASIGADSISTGSGRDTIYAQGVGASADSAGDTVTGGSGADYIDLGLSGAGDTDYLIFGAETLGSSFGSADLAASQHSSRANLDSVINFDVDGNTAAESISHDVFRFDFSVLADSVGAGTYLTNGVLSGAAFDAVSGLPSSTAGGTLANAITEVESWLGTDLTAGEVFAFYWSGSWYVAVGANMTGSGSNKVGSVVQFVGVSDIDRVTDLGSGVYKLYDDSTMAGPGGG